MVHRGSPDDPIIEHCTAPCEPTNCPLWGTGDHLMTLYYHSWNILGALESEGSLTWFSSLYSMISEWPGTSSGPGVVLSVTPGAIQALGVL